METLIELLFTFLKIGALSFGGGHAMIPFIQEAVVSNGWLTISEFTDIVVISEITPGPLAVNMATFVGYTQSSVVGSLVATLGVCLPSFTIIAILVKFFVKFGETKFVKSIFMGLRPVVLGLIFSSALTISWLEFFPETSSISFVITNVNVKSICIFIVSLFCIYKFKLNPIIAIIISAFAGIILF